MSDTKTEEPIETPTDSTRSEDSRDPSCSPPVDMGTISTPDGEQESIEDAIAKWRELTAPLESLGFDVHAFDPGVQFRCPDSGKIMDLTVSAIRRINAALL